MSTLREIIHENVREGELFEKLDRNWVRCFACGHCCKIPEGQPGVCKVRYNRSGSLFVPWGYGFGMLGCDLHCGYCQNWVTSQALRDPAAVVGPMRVTPAELVHDALRQGGRVIVSTYNEPLITSEWAIAVFKEARVSGLVTGFVSNGNGTPQVLEYVRPWVDLYKVDLKSFDDRHYRQLGGRLQPILDSIGRLHEMGFWLEFNDCNDELTRLAEFLAGVSPDIPWHVTAFHKDYKMTDPENTTAKTLIRAAEIGKSAGLRYVYAGNLPGMVGDWENTRCPNCRAASHRTPQLSDHRLLPYASGLLPILWRQHSRTVGSCVSGTDYRSSLCSAHALPIRFSCIRLLRSPDHFLSWVSTIRRNGERTWQS